MTSARESSSPARPTRRQARERALSLLYEAETKEVDPAEVLAALPVEPAPYAVELVEGVAAHISELDGYLNGYAKDWTVDRMPAVDRAVLRMSVFELRYRPDVPTAAVLSEAVELAQAYSTEDSAGFVNGMLARIAASVRPEAAPASEGKPEKS